MPPQKRTRAAKPEPKVTPEDVIAVGGAEEEAEALADVANAMRENTDLTVEAIQAAEVKPADESDPLVQAIAELSRRDDVAEQFDAEAETERAEESEALRALDEPPLAYLGHDERYVYVRTDDGRIKAAQLTREDLVRLPHSGRSIEHYAGLTPHYREEVAALAALFTNDPAKGWVEVPSLPSGQGFYPTPDPLPDGAIIAIVGPAQPAFTPPTDSTEGEGDEQHAKNREWAMTVLTTAFEGGIGYWSRAYNVERVENSDWEYDGYVKRLDLVEWESAQDELKVSVAQLDALVEAGDERIKQFAHVVTADSLISASEKLFAEGRELFVGQDIAKLSFGDHDEWLGEVDAGIADCLVQYAALGEIRYS